MANPEHVASINKGAGFWDQWRRENRDVQPDLSDAYLNRTDLSGANLIDANLSGADLSGSDLSYAHLGRANLNGANLNGVNFNNAILNGANLKGAKVGWTSFGDVDLRPVKGLETVVHIGPSHISTSTLSCSQGDIPEIFLQGAGVSKGFITYARSLVNNPIDYYTCFISYSSKDEAFARRLYESLQNNNVRCWFAPHDMRIGDKIRPRIDESILLYDKLLLVLSEHSVTSQWVEHEVETALGKELDGKPNVLFPIRLDDKVMESKTGWASHIRLTRHVGDFRNWKNHDEYQQAFNQLLRDLKAEAETTEI